MAKFNQVPIRNFTRASGTVFSGSEPGAVGLEFIRGLGIKTVIDLRKPGHGADLEFEQARKHGLNYFNIGTGYFGLSDNVIASFLAVVLNPNFQPVYVHCNDGIDRTGALIAIYRIAVEGWPVEWARTELQAHKFRPWQIFLKHSVNRVGEQLSPLDFQERLWKVQELVGWNG
jgi:tyrosine-protein phosphatase SIW14